MDALDGHPHVAKVRVAGSNPVFRSKQNRRSGTLSRVSDLLSKAMVGRAICLRAISSLTSRNGFPCSCGLRKVMLYDLQTPGLIDRQDTRTATHSLPSALT